MMEELKTMNTFMSNTEETNPNEYEHVIEDEVMLMVNIQGKLISVLVGWGKERSHFKI